MMWNELWSHSQVWSLVSSRQESVSGLYYFHAPEKSHFACLDIFYPQVGVHNGYVITVFVMCNLFDV